MVIKMLVAAVSCCDVVVGILSPDLTETAQGIAEWFYDKETERQSASPVQADTLEHELEIKIA
jgi:hypothetical protein